MHPAIHALIAGGAALALVATMPAAQASCSEVGKPCCDARDGRLSAILHHAPWPYHHEDTRRSLDSPSRSPR